MKDSGKINIDNLINSIFDISDENSFIKLSLIIFGFQYNNCAIYKDFCNLLKKTPDNVQCLSDIPFMPIDFFRDHKILSKNNIKEGLCFYSSTTTHSKPSKHYIADKEIYNKSLLKNFKHFFGDPQKYCIVALLPGYLERGNSSLVYMVKELIKHSNRKENGFYLNNHNELKKTLDNNNKRGDKTILIGASYALLDFAEKFPMKLNDTIVIETGGMKGRRKEIIRKDLHKKLKSAFKIKQIASEYGMTELLSQAYSLKDGKYSTPNWMKIFIREINDPFSFCKYEKTGAINVIDLANIYSCSFISTYDVGKKNKKNTFEVLGRLDNSEIRGCNLMIG